MYIMNLDKDLFDKVYYIGRLSENYSECSCCDTGVVSFTDEGIEFPFRVICEYEDGSDEWVIRSVFFTYEEFTNMSFEDIMERFYIIKDELTEIYNTNSHKSLDKF